MNYKLLLCIALGLVFGLNNIIGYLFVNNYTPFSASGAWVQDEIYYAAKIHYFSLTNNISSIYAYSDSIPIILLGIINKFISVDIIFFFAPFIFIPILFYTVFLFCKQIGMDEYPSIITSLFTITLPQFYNLLPSTVPYVKISYFQRFPEIMFSGILFFLTLTILHRIYTNTAKKHDKVIAGILVGSMLYVYFYFGSILLILLFALVLYDKTFSKSLLIAIIISIPAVLISLNSPEWMKDVLGEHLYYITYQRLIRTFLLALICLYYERFLGLILFIGGILELFGSNHIPQADHYNLTIIAPITILTCCYIISRHYIISKNKAILIIVLLFTILTAHQIIYGLTIPLTDNNTELLNKEYNEIMRGTEIREIYPIIMLKNTPDSIKDYLYSKGANLSNIHIQEYYCHASCE